MKDKIEILESKTDYQKNKLKEAIQVQIHKHVQDEKDDKMERKRMPVNVAIICFSCTVHGGFSSNTVHGGFKHD